MWAHVFTEHYVFTVLTSAPCCKSCQPLWFFDINFSFPACFLYDTEEEIEVKIDDRNKKEEEENKIEKRNCAVLKPYDLIGAFIIGEISYLSE